MVLRNLIIFLFCQVLSPLLAYADDLHQITDPCDELVADSVDSSPEDKTAAQEIVRAAFAAIEKSGYRVQTKIFDETIVPPSVAKELNTAIQKATGIRDLTLAQVFLMIPWEKTAEEFRAELMGPVNENTELKTIAATQTRTIVAAKRRRTDLAALNPDLNAEELDDSVRVDPKEWLARIFKMMKAAGELPNFYSIARQPDSNGILSVVELYFNGSLYDAVVALDLNPVEVFEDAKYRVSNQVEKMLNAIHKLMRDNPHRSALIDDLAQALSLEFPFADQNIVKAIVRIMFTTNLMTAGEFSSYIQGDVANTDLPRHLATTDNIQRLLLKLSRNRTLMKFLDL